MAGLSRAYAFGIAGLISHGLWAQTPAAAADSIKISSGLVENQVLQRDSNGVGSASLSGTAPARLNNKYIEAKVSKDGTDVLPWNVLGQIKAGKWTGPLSNVPTGGPFQVDFRVTLAQGQVVSASITNVLVGDLWVLAGQSNMEGVGNLVDVAQPNAVVHSFDMTDVWGIAREPLHTLPSAIDQVHWAKGKDRLAGEQLEKFIANRKKGAGPGLPFAISMYQHTSIPVGLVPCAHGGTSMDQWDPSKKGEGGDSLYGATIRRILAVGGKIKGILWYQGEAEASAKLAPVFQTKFEKLIQAFRADTAQPDLPFYYVQIGLHVSNGAPLEWNAVQEAQRQVELKLPHVGMVAAVDVALDDQIHVSTPDQMRIGRRLAALAAHDLYPDVAKENAAVKRGPRPVSARYNDHVIRVTFKEVNGQLTAEGRIAGFVVVNPEGQPLATIYKSRFDAKDGNVIDLETYGDIPPGSMLRYGIGRNPYCNVRDTLDMGLPVFGPLPIENLSAAKPKA